MKLNKQMLYQILDIYRKQPWLAHKEEQFMELLNLCKNLREQRLIFSLITHFCYLESNDMEKSIEALVASIEDNVDANRVQIVASSFNQNPDSSQALLWMMKPFLASADLRGIPLVNLWPKSVKYLPERSNILILEDFAGTGETLLKRYSDLRGTVKGQFPDLDFSISIYVITCMNAAYELIKSQGIEINCIRLLKKGIGGYFYGRELRKMYNAMYNLECRLLSKFEKTQLPHFGYGQAEALYNVVNGNIPNSVFPVFWWPILHNGEKRNTLFVRYEL